VPMLNLLS